MQNTRFKWSLTQNVFQRKYSQLPNKTAILKILI